jgi:hypothetical protein
VRNKADPDACGIRMKRPASAAPSEKSVTSSARPAISASTA